MADVSSRAPNPIWLQRSWLGRTAPGRRVAGHLARHGDVITGYLALISGSAGRLVFSLVYFLVLANTLPVADFGVFAAVSAMGVVLSRVFGLGFSSPLYRTATVKPQLIGAYLTGYGLMGLASLPVVAMAAWAAHAFLFSRDIALWPFAIIILAEVLFWRSAEIIIIINNGLRRFTAAALMTIGGTAARMMAALLFAWSEADPSLERWAVFYLGANLVSMAMIAVAGWPKSRLHFAPRLYGRRMRDALSVAGGEIVFFAQMELDKVLMLAIAGAEMTGLYAIIMRLVDLTAIPIRAFNTLLVQSLMKNPAAMASLKLRAATEGGIALASILAMGGLTLALAWKPALLGQSIAMAAPALLFALAIPSLRNLTEYHAELLYARGQTVARVVLLSALGALKAAGMVVLLVPDMTASSLMAMMTFVFFGLYALSAAATYSLLGREARRF